MTTISGRLTFEDYLRAHRFHSRPRTLVLWFVLLAAAGTVWFLSGDSYLFIFVAAYLAGIRPFIVRTRLRRNWSNTPLFHGGKQRFTFDDHGIHGEDDKGNPATLPWDTFIRYKESNHSFLLYLGPNTYFFFPKEIIKPGDREELRQLFKKNISS